MVFMLLWFLLLGDIISFEIMFKREVKWNTYAAPATVSKRGFKKIVTERSGRLWIKSYKSGDRPRKLTLKYSGELIFDLYLFTRNLIHLIQF